MLTKGMIMIIGGIAGNIITIIFIIISLIGEAREKRKASSSSGIDYSSLNIQERNDK